MPVPTSTTELCRVLGMVNYLAQYIPGLDTVTKSMNDLLHKDVAWMWGPTQKGSFEDVKRLITSAPILHIMTHIYL